MINKMTFLSGILSLGLVLPTPANATDWTVLKDKSNLSFTFTQNNSETEGRFENFDATIHFDPTTPENASISVEIDLSSVVLPTEEMSDTVKSTDFFDLKTQAIASWQSAQVTKLQGNTYLAQGHLNLKGHTEPADLEFTFEEEQTGLATATGKLTQPLSRTAYSVGTGQWADTKLIADDVQIKFEINAQKQTP